MHNPRKTHRGVAMLLLAALAMGNIKAADVVRMPGAPQQGNLPRPDDTERELAERLRQHVNAIAMAERNTEHPDNLEDAARYIENTLAGFGYDVRQQVFNADGKRVRNLEVVIRKPGTKNGMPRIVVVGAHYDSARGSPGANDNASGTAAVIELARILMQMPLKEGYEVRLVLFVNEEAPYFNTPKMGSFVHARNLRENGEQVIGMLSLETIGYYSDTKGSQHYPPPLESLYPDKGNFIAFVSDLGARDLLQKSLASFREHSSFPSEGVAAPATLPGISLSDHWAYRKHGYPALMITDTAPYRYPYYHTPQDTPDKIDYERMARVVKGVGHVVHDLVNSN